MELIILIKCSFVNKIIWRISPFHIALFFSPIYINSRELIILIRNSLGSLSIKCIVFKASSILELFGNILALLTIRKVIFHRTSKMRAIFHNIKQSPYAFPAEKLPINNDPFSLYILPILVGLPILK